MAEDAAWDRPVEAQIDDAAWDRPSRPRTTTSP
jgi:hypothetical protein